MKTVREQVVMLLIQTEKEKSYAQLSLKHALGEFDKKDRALITEIFYGTLKYEIQLDYFIGQYSKVPVRKMKPLIRNILRMSLYQMLHMDKIPVSAVINEAVKIVKKRKMQGLAGFVNGLLRQLDREKENLQFPDEKEGLSYRLSIQYALPEWMITMWLESYGREKTEKIGAALNERAKVCGRCNTLKNSMTELKDILMAEGITTEQGSLLKEAFYLKKMDQIAVSRSFQEGRWTVQDESAMLTAHVLNPEPGETILDMCSAPGGKSLQMAALMKNKGQILACDIHPHKLELIEKNAKRLDVKIIQPVLQDGTVFKKEWENHFDRVLLDAPCSGLGIMKRKPDIRLNKKPEDIQDIEKIQEALFENAVRYLKEDGILVYSTCTISKAENEEMVRKMCQTYGLELNDIAHNIPECLKSEIQEKGMIQILPDLRQTDGFFIASLRKRSSC